MTPKLLLPFALGHCANDIAPVGMYLIIPAFGVAMGLSPVEIGLLFTIHSFGSAVAYLPAGILTDHVANRGVLLTATFFWVGLGYLGASLADEYWTFALLIAVAGAGDAAWHPIATGVLARVHRERRAYALGVHALGGHMAEVIAPLAAGYILALSDWSTALLILVLPGLVMGLAFTRIMARVPRIEASAPRRADAAALWRSWTSRAGLRVVLLFTTYNMGLVATLTMTPLFLQSHHRLDWQETAIALAVMMVLGALAQPLTGRTSDRIGRRPLLVIGNGIAAAAAVTAWQAPSLIVALIALGTVLTTLVAIRVVVLAVALDHSDRREGISLGFAFVFMDGIGATGAVLAGWVGERDLSQAFLLAAVFSIATVFLACFRTHAAVRAVGGDRAAEPGR